MVETTVSDRVDDGVKGRVTIVKYFYCHENAHVPYERACDAPLKEQDRQKEWKPTKNKNASYQGNGISNMKVL